MALSVGCNETTCPEGASGALCSTDLPRCDDYDGLRRPFWGDTHVHTTLSFDANTSDTRLGPEDAYRFARGETVGIQPHDAEGNPTRTYTIDRPLDFTAVTDHSEFLGTVVLCEDPSSPQYDTEECTRFREVPADAFDELAALLVFEAGYPNLCGRDGTACINEGLDVWKGIQDANEQANDHCSFTSFVAYEWTCNPNSNNLHRNVIFRNEIVPERVTSCFEEGQVEGLWEKLRSDCLDADTGCDVLTIPHNSNLASGTFFEDKTRDGNPLDAEYASERAMMEPVIELYQHKGASECLPDAPLISDELCGFEVIPYTNFVGTNFGIPQTPLFPQDFVRGAFGEGLEFEETLGVNPFKHGIIAATDTHAAIPGGAMEAEYPGHGAAVSSGIDEGGFFDDPYMSAGGHAAVYAEENSREAIFEGFRRKETYGTSGPRMMVRFFGGWDYPTDICESTELVRTGYDQGVPMGGDLSSPPSDTAKPVFVLSALQDPGTAERPGTPLQRIQVIKGWLDATEGFQLEVVEVAGNPDNGASVDLETCEPTGPGESMLCARWIDEEFDPTERAYYYARVVENPICRWTTAQCVEGNYDCEDPSTQLDRDCCDPVLGLNAICETVESDAPRPELIAVNATPNRTIKRRAATTTSMIENPQ